MKNGFQLTKGIFVALLLFAVFLIALNYDSLTIRYNLHPYLIPLGGLIVILSVGYKFVVLYLDVHKLEREFTTIVNHVFRTPLTGILWFTKELEKDLPAKERLTYGENITNALDKLLGIVDIFAGVKNINDVSGYFFEATSVREIIERSLARHREELNKKHIKLETSTFKNVPLLTLDLKKISFVVDTLIENALLYTPVGGRIVIDCQVKRQKLILYVSDSGIGLGFLDRMNIFSRFYRGKRARLMNTEGMGLRLYLSKQIVKRHSGRIYAKSEGENSGSTFFLELPFHN